MSLTLYYSIILTDLYVCITTLPGLSPRPALPDVCVSNKSSSDAEYTGIFKTESAVKIQQLLHL